MLLISDLHFRHKKVALIRGFETVEEHDQYLMAQWRNFVDKDEVVYILGDISSGRDVEEYEALKILEDLPGEKHLYLGNHDSPSGIHRKTYPSRTEQFRQVFHTINDYGRIRMEKVDVYLSHYPYLSSGDGPGRGEARYAWARLMDMGGLLVHGHTHHNHPTSGSVTGRELCVSWDARRGFTTQGDLSKWVREMKEKGLA